MVNEDAPGITDATTDVESRVIDQLVLAFCTDPLSRWFFPDPAAYLEHYPTFIRRYGGRAFDAGTVYHTHDFGAAALWLPPDVQPDEPGLIALLAETLSDRQRQEAWEVFEEIEELRPTEPYWHLSHIGVDPTKQRQGLGSALMKHALAPIDREGDVAYLESTNPENTALYARFGFDALGTIRADTMPPITPMKRDVRS